MKTAMQELKIWIDDQVNLGFLDKKYSERLKWYIGYYFLEKEKEQIIDAANQKIFGDITFTGSDKVITKGENYYNQTYNI
jgi:hypothetical protein